jgi:MoxR-like ATPase
MESQAKWFEGEFSKLVDTICMSFFGKREVVEAVLYSLFARTHVLLEDMPGSGKTHLAKTVAKSLQGVFKRIQFTPDLLPSDITGIQVYNQATKQFVFYEGPIFANIVLADEINRASAKTQSALLEVMEEKTITIDNFTRQLHDPFIVIATQNPIEQAGTYPLPEAQLDRFGIKTSIGYLDYQFALEALRSESHQEMRLDELACVELKTVQMMQQLVSSVAAKENLLDYILRVVEATRTDKRVLAGVSHRGAALWLRLAKAKALSAGRSFAMVSDVKELAMSCLEHRIVLKDSASFEGVEPREVIQDALDSTAVPRG